MATLDADERNAIPTKSFAFPKERKEPLENASHVRNAIARFNQVEGVSDAERDAAWKRIKAAAKKFGVEVQEGSWREIGAGSRTAAKKTASKKIASKKTAAKKTAAKKTSAKKTAAKKTPAKKTAAKKTAAKKTAAKKAAA